MRSITVVMPTFNDAARIVATLEHVWVPQVEPVLAELHSCEGSRIRQSRHAAERYSVLG